MNLLEVDLSLPNDQLEIHVKQIWDALDAAKMVIGFRKKPLPGTASPKSLKNLVCKQLL
jgi:hypothetical protein